MDVAPAPSLVAVLDAPALVVVVVACVELSFCLSDVAVVVPLNAGVRVRVRVDAALDVSTSKLSLCTGSLVEVSVVICSVVLVGLGVGLGVDIGLGVLSGAAVLLHPPLAASGQICSGPTFARNATTRFCPVTPCPPHADLIGPTMACSALTHVSVHCLVVKSGTPQPEICES